MKNKFLIIYLILFSYLTIFDKLLANDFIFETSTVEITNKGEVVKATNGSATTNDGNIKIIANQFEYNKKLSILKAAGNVTVIDILNELTLKSENILYEVKNEIIQSNSDSSIIDNLNNLFYLESFSYNLKKKIIKMDEVKVVDSENNKINLNKAYLNLNLGRLVGKDMSIDFDNKSFEINNEPRIKALSISADKDASYYNKGIFTTCKKDDSCPPWQISAKEIKHDKKKKVIYYKDAWFKIYNKPVLYFPKFFHPDPTVKRQSGFLTSSFKDSTSTGTSVQIPYFMAISNNKDATFSPQLFSNKILLQTEYRQANKNSNHILDFSFLNDETGSTKSHFFSNSEKVLDLKGFDDSKLKIRFEHANNDSYLKTYKLKSPILKDNNLLTSSVGLSAYRDDLNFDIDFYRYENLNVTGNDKWEYIFPSYNLSKKQNYDFGLDGNFRFDSAGYIKNISTNTTEKILVNDLYFDSSQKYTNLGIKSGYRALFRNTTSDSKNSKKYKDSPNSVVYSIFEYNSSYPLIKKNKETKDTLKPQISLKFSPNRSKNIRTKQKRIDVNNIFSLNRISQSDSVEGGSSLTYGLEYNKSDNASNRDIFTAKLANIFRAEEDENLPKSSTIGQKTSNIVGNLNFDPHNFFNINYDFALDENLIRQNYQLLSTQIAVNNFVNTFEYLNENNTKLNESYLSNEFAYKLSEDKKMIFNTRINKKTNLTEFYNLIYEYKNDCLIAAIEYNKDYYSNGDLKPQESIFFKLTIVPFGETNSPNLMK